MDLVILEGLNITVNLAEIATIKTLQVDNPRYIPAIPDKNVKEQGGPPYFEFTEVTLKSGKEVVLEIPYATFILIVKKWMTDAGGVNINKENEEAQDGSGEVEAGDK
jgi:hypothetical protein